MNRIREESGITQAVANEEGFVSSAAKAFFWGVFAAIGLTVGYYVVNKVGAKK